MRTRSRRTEKCVLSRIDDNGCVPFPHRQIPRPGMRNLSKSVDPLIQLPRVGIGVRKACFLIDGVNQMGAVFLRMSLIPDLQCRPDDRHAFVQSNQTKRFCQRRLPNQMPVLLGLKRRPETAEGDQQYNGHVLLDRRRHLSKFYRKSEGREDYGRPASGISRRNFYIRTRANGSIPVDLIWGASDSRTSRNTSALGTLSDRTLNAASHFPCCLTRRIVPTISARVICETGIVLPFHVMAVAESPTGPNSTVSPLCKRAFTAFTIGGRIRSKIIPIASLPQRILRRCVKRRRTL